MLKKLSYLRPYLLRYRRKLVIGFLAILGSVLVGLGTPLLVGQVIDLLRQKVSRETPIRAALTSRS